MPKLLSIIVPSYNMEKFLPKCLGSLIVDDAELLQLLDVIVVNDGSKDRTSEIAHEFERKYPGVFQVIDKSNGHYGSCVNAALPVARGKYVRLLDADDYFDTSVFAAYLKWLKDVSERWDPDCLVSDFSYVDKNYQLKSTTHYGFPCDRVFTPNESLEYTGVNIGVHAIAHKLSILRSTGFHQTEGVPYTDTEWSFLPMFAVKSIAYFPQSVKQYLVEREGQTMSQEQLAANASKYAMVVERILREYGCARAYFTSEIDRYCKYVVLELIKWVLSIYLLGDKNGALAKDVSSKLDLALKENAPDIYEETNSVTASRLKFHYIRQWRKCGYDDSGLTFITYRLYRKVVTGIRKAVNGAH